MLDADGNLLNMNRAGLDLIEADSLDQVKGQCIYPLVSGEHREAFQDLVRDVFQGKPRSMEFKIAGLKGRVRWLYTKAVPMRNSAGDIVSLLSVTDDITSRKEAEEKLRQSEEKYKLLVEATHTGYVILDSSGRVIDANQEYVGMTGHEALDEILGRSVVEWTAEYDLERNAEAVRKCADTGYVRGLLIDYVSRDGRITPIEINADVMHIDDTVRIYTLCRDVSGQRLLEEERLKAQKLESIGTLAGGIAHDFNNLLQGVFGYISLAKMSLDSPDRIKSHAAAG